MSLDLIAEAQFTVNSFRPHPYYSTYSKYETGYWGSIPEWLAQQCSLPHVLDIGCAYGTLLAYCYMKAAVKLSAIDNGNYLSTELIEALFIQYHRMNVETEEYTGEKASHVILTETLEHFNLHPSGTLTKIRDMMLPNGRLYLSTPNADHPAWGRNHKYHKQLSDMPKVTSGITIDDHIWHYNEGEVRGLLAFAGFSVLKLETDKHIVLEAIYA